MNGPLRWLGYDTSCIITRVRILGRNLDKSLQSFPPCYSQLACNVNIVYENLSMRTLKSQDYAQKRQRNCMFMNSASVLKPCCPYIIKSGNRLRCRMRMFFGPNGPRYRSCHLRSQKGHGPLEKSRFCAKGPFRILEMAPFSDFHVLIS